MNIKKLLSSDKFMGLVNVLFFFAAFIGNNSFIFIAHICWFLYLLFCMKNTNSKSAKTIYQYLLIIPGFLILGNLYLYLVPAP